jgi:winged helix DNA-binding protein
MNTETIARLRMRGQRLWGTPLGDPEEVVEWLVALQAQEYAYATWSVAQRAGRTDKAAVERAYNEGKFLRTHVLRPTWHFVSTNDLRWLIQLSGPRVNAVNARRYQELGLTSKLLARANDVIADALAGTQLTRPELAAVLNRKRITTDGQRMAHILLRAELDGVICSGPLRGFQQTYALFDDRVPPGNTLDREEALAELARRFFESRGPATLKDFSWWSGFTMRDARIGLEAVKASFMTADLEGRTYWYAPSRRSKPTTAKINLVQCYDESIISYSESRDVLQSEPVTFPVPRNLEGFVHVILCDGRLLGHWRILRSRRGSALETRLARSLTPEEESSLDAETSRYLQFLGSQNL